MVMKTGREWLLVESSKLQDRRQQNSVIRNLIESGLKLRSAQLLFRQPGTLTVDFSYDV